MKAKVIEIRWNDKQPIYSTDFHAIAPTEHTRTHKHGHDAAWRLATCGGDNKIRLWLVQPRPSAQASAPHPTAASLLAAIKSAAEQPPPSRSGPAAAAAPEEPVASTSKAPAPIPAAAAGSTPDPKVEYLATLSQHQGVVNCVRFSPAGDALASAGDDGNILIWVPGEGTKSFGEAATEDLAFERESWRVKGMIRSLSGKEIYDLAWSPCGTRILAGSVDHTATIYDTATCSPLYRIAEHTNYVQGVAWDPRGGYIATQSSDRTMHVYEVKERSTGGGAAAGGADVLGGAATLEVHAVGKNSRMEMAVPPARSGAAAVAAAAPSTSRSSSKATRPAMPRTHSARSESASSETSSVASHAHSHSQSHGPASTTATSTGKAATTADEEQQEVTTAMDPPQGIPHHPPAPSPSPSHSAPAPPARVRSNSNSNSHSHAGGHSRRSSASSMSPGLPPRTGSGGGGSRPPLRSPSPAPLPAVMPPLSPKPSFAEPAPPSAATAPVRAPGSNDAPARPSGSVKLYSDANSTHFFRRLAWSPDGALLLTPAGLWEDPYAAASMQAQAAAAAAASAAPGTPSSSASASKPANSVAMTATSSTGTEPKPTVYIYSRTNLARPPIAHLPGHRTTSLGIRFCPVLWQLRSTTAMAAAAAEGRRGRPQRRRADEEVGAADGGDMEQDGEAEAGDDDEEDENAVSVQLSTDGVDVPLSGSAATEEESTPSSARPKSLFDLPYRMVYAVATLDSVYLYDTQQAGPLAMLGNLHYAPFTDLTWSPDGNTLVVSSQDGYCSIVAFAPGELGTPFDLSTVDFPRPRAIAPAAAPAPAPAPAPPASTEVVSSAGAAVSTGLAAPDVPPPSAAAAQGSVAPSAATDALDLLGGTKRPAGPTEGETSASEPAVKKVKRRVAPTLLK
ncbi:hypothetical protein JCM8202_000470 [Rhodotorula sphaerocarpa]